MIARARTFSDPGVPGIAALRLRGTQSLAELLHAIRHRQPRDELQALVAQLPRDTQPQRTAIAHWNLTAVHPVSHHGLRMQSVRHIDAFPPVRLDREVDYVPG